MTALTKWVVRLVGILAACGCSKSDPNPAAGSEEDAVKKAFTAFQGALKSHDGEKVLGLLDSGSRAEAERTAQATKEGYVKATVAEKGETENALGVAAAELVALDAQGFLKSKRFNGKYEALAESKFDKATLHGDSATAHYVEPNGAKGKIGLVKQDGGWKVSVPMPK